MTELWNWRIDGGEPVEVYPALAEALGRVVMPLAVADPARLPAYAVVCDVWEAPGLYAHRGRLLRRAREPGRAARASRRWPGCWAATACCATTRSTPAGTCWSPRTARSARCTSTWPTPTTARCSATTGSARRPTRAAGAGRSATAPAGPPTRSPRRSPPPDRERARRRRDGHAPPRAGAGARPASERWRAISGSVARRRGRPAGQPRAAGCWPRTTSWSSSVAVAAATASTAASNAAALCAAGVRNRRSSGRTATRRRGCPPRSPPGRTAHAGS